MDTRPAAHSVDGLDLYARSYSCRAPGCIELADCAFDGWPLCLDCADMWLEWICVERRYRRSFADLFDGTARLKSVGSAL